MKTSLVTSIISTLSVIAILSVASPVSATVSNNRGSIVKINASCSQLADSISNNRGSIIKVTGDGTCDVNELIKSGAVENNRGSIIRIEGVCGEASGEVKNNRGTIVKIESNGKCVTTIKHETKSKTVKDEKQATPEVKGDNIVVKDDTLDAKGSDIPEVLPNTGSGNMAAVAAGVALVSIVAAVAVRRLAL